MTMAIRQDVMPAEQEGSLPGAKLIAGIAAEVTERLHRATVVGYNERYTDGGPAWGEHINYSDGGQHGQTHRP